MGTFLIPLVAATAPPGEPPLAANATAGPASSTSNPVPGGSDGFGTLVAQLMASLDVESQAGSAGEQNIEEQLDRALFDSADAPLPTDSRRAARGIDLLGATDWLLVEGASSPAVRPDPVRGRNASTVSSDGEDVVGVPAGDGTSDDEERLVLPAPMPKPEDLPATHLEPQIQTPNLATDTSAPVPVPREGGLPTEVDRLDGGGRDETGPSGMNHPASGFAGPLAEYGSSRQGLGHSGQALVAASTAMPSQVEGWTPPADPQPMAPSDPITDDTAEPLVNEAAGAGRAGSAPFTPPAGRLDRPAKIAELAVAVESNETAAGIEVATDVASESSPRPRRRAQTVEQLESEAPAVNGRDPLLSLIGLTKPVSSRRTAGEGRIKPGADASVAQGTLAPTQPFDLRPGAQMEVQTARGSEGVAEPAKSGPPADGVPPSRHRLAAAMAAIGTQAEAEPTDSAMSATPGQAGEANQLPSVGRRTGEFAEPLLHHSPTLLASGSDAAALVAVPAQMLLSRSGASAVEAYGQLSTGFAEPLATTGPFDGQPHEQVLRGIRVQWHQGVGEARLVLQPENLGHVDVQLRVEQGSVTALLRAETAEAADWIRTHHDDLKAALADQGLDLDSLDVVVDPDGRRRRNGPNQQEAEIPQRSRRRMAELPIFDIHV